MTLIITQTVFRDLQAAAQVAAPLEACGLLAGTGGRITKAYSLTNVDESADHFSMKPEDQFAAVKNMRAAGLKLVGLWHSHPATPARMSEEDLRLAYTPDIQYVIVSLAEVGGPCLRAFTVRDGIAHETPVMIEEQKGES